MKLVFSMTLALALLASAPALAWGGHGDQGDKIDVMTQNQYLGADLNPIIAAPDPVAFNAALIDALQQIAANNYPARARKLAQLIAFRRPELVGLQEMFQFVCYETGFPGAVANACQLPSISGAFNDHLHETLRDLKKLGKRYNAAAIVDNLDLTATLPGLLTPGLPVFLNDDPIPDITVTVLDRDVILARGDIVDSVDPVSFPCTKPSADGCNYTTVASVEDTPIGDIFIERGFVGVDATVDGKQYRFVNTHLEVQEPDGTEASSIVQAAQAAELIGVLGLTTPPDRSLIVVGDINSSSEDPLIPGPWPFPPPFDQAIIPPYALLVAAGYTDAWTELPYPRPGFTCCQESDLSNKYSILDERIDVIFSADAPDSVRRGRVLGATLWSKTWSTWPKPLWPSDHGSVAAELEF
ncbi:MAG: hypothetical protein WBN14_14375 [Polyangiales bacterium]